ncbi:SRPBCC family protein [Streptomyces longwoodensis]|uniref:SRPBCC family protein n=1 Tax=Streptomyces longwoodensis TaxID=68231 RepID=UPI00340252F5
MQEPTAIASVHVHARPGTVYRLLTDLSQWRAFVAECRVTPGPFTARVGERFRGTNRRGPMVWRTTATVTQATPDRCFAFRVTLFGMPVSYWRYDIVPTDRGCRVTESTRDHRRTLMRVVSIPATGVVDRAAHNRRNIQRTLTRLKALAEAAEGGTSAGQGEGGPAGAEGTAGVAEADGNRR